MMTMIQCCLLNIVVQLFHPEFWMMIILQFMVLLQVRLVINLPWVEQLQSLVYMWIKLTNRCSMWLNIQILYIPDFRSGMFFLCYFYTLNLEFSSSLYKKSSRRIQIHTSKKVKYDMKVFDEPFSTIKTEYQVRFIMKINVKLTEQINQVSIFYLYQSNMVCAKIIVVTET